MSSLSADLDNLVSAQHPLDQVLERTAVCLAAGNGRGGRSQAAIEGSGGEEEGESTGSEGMDDDGDDDDDDDYYGEDVDVDAMDVGPSQAQARYD